MKNYSALLGVVISIGLILIAGYMIRERQDFLSKAGSATGIVISLNAGSAHPEIEFSAADGETYRYPQGGMIYGYRVGQSVKVLYLQEDPQITAVIDNSGATWGPALLVALIGLGLGILSIFSLHATWKKNEI